MSKQGPGLCEEYLPYSEKDQGFVVCHGQLPCVKEHASTRDVSVKFNEWGYKQGLTEVYFCLLTGISIDELKQFIVEEVEGYMAGALPE